MQSSQNYNNAYYTPRSLSQLIGEVCNVVNQTFTQYYWVTAELSDVRPNPQSGHCYLTLLEKDPANGNLIAQVRAAIWSNRWFFIRESFRMQTGQEFKSGIKVMLLVKLQMNAAYGLNVIIHDVNPAYTLGEMERNRKVILAQLQKDGVLTKNKDIQFPILPQRIAIISAGNAAGYQDFMQELLNGNNLTDNQNRPVVYTKLFTATMQGKETRTSVIAALNSILEHKDLFDVVVIIRGGGATVDLASFDDYELAYNIAIFPLPVIAGIGHDRDKTVVDEVAHTSVKTPTAAAQYIMGILLQQYQHITDLQQTMIQAVQLRQERERARLTQIASVVTNSRHIISRKINELDMIRERIKAATSARIAANQARLDLLLQTVRMCQPDDILKRGFSIVRAGGHVVRSATEVTPDSIIEVTTANDKFIAKCVNQG